MYDVEHIIGAVIILVIGMAIGGIGCSGNIGTVDEVMYIGGGYFMVPIEEVHAFENSLMKGEEPISVTNLYNVFWIKIGDIDHDSLSPEFFNDGYNPGRAENAPPEDAYIDPYRALIESRVQGKLYHYPKSSTDVIEAAKFVTTTEIDFVELD